MELVERHGQQCWSLIATFLTGCIGKQCPKRRHNHLRLDIKCDSWNKEEEEVLVSAHNNLGNRWADIAKFIPAELLAKISLTFWNPRRLRLTITIIATRTCMQILSSSYYWLEKFNKEQDPAECNCIFVQMEDKDEESSLTLVPYFEANLNSIDVDYIMHLLCAATHGQDEDDHHGRLGECGISSYGTRLATTQIGNLMLQSAACFTPFVNCGAMILDSSTVQEQPSCVLILGQGVTMSTMMHIQLLCVMVLEHGKEEEEEKC
ncbi:unnamed protein product [Sphagnum balticum]